MTPEAQRITIAEACGWTPIPSYLPSRVWSRPDLEEFDETELCGVEQLPNYPFDLKTMHDAVDYANKHQIAGWDDEHFLKTLCAWTGGFPHRATATQWAEAFLRTLGKWEDDK